MEIDITKYSSAVSSTEAKRSEKLTEAQRVEYLL
jgi:hypothetical protein